MSITRSIRSPLFALVLLALSAAAYAQLSVSISFAPPELPVYEQPMLPGDGYIWTPGYWAYADDDTVTTGCRAHGSWLRNLVCSGLRPIGAGAATDMFSIKATGASR